MWFLLGIPAGWFLCKFWTGRKGTTVVGDARDDRARGLTDRERELGYRIWSTPYDAGWNDCLDGNITIYNSGNAAVEYKRGFDEAIKFKMKSLNL